MLNYDLFKFCFPGIYKIICLKNGKIYIGESNNCLYRIGRHFNDLENDLHHCQPLVKDFQKYGRRCFKATIIKSNNKEMVSEQIRKKEEAFLISQIK